MLWHFLKKKSTISTMLICWFFAVFVVLFVSLKIYWPHAWVFVFFALHFFCVCDFFLFFFEFVFSFLYRYLVLWTCLLELPSLFPLSFSMFFIHFHLFLEVFCFFVNLSLDPFVQFPWFLSFLLFVLLLMSIFNSWLSDKMQYVMFSFFLLRIVSCIWVNRQFWRKFQELLRR